MDTIEGSNHIKSLAGARFIANILIEERDELCMRWVRETSEMAMDIIIVFKI